MKRTVLPIVAAVAAILGMISVARTRPKRQPTVQAPSEGLRNGLTSQDDATWTQMFARVTREQKRENELSLAALGPIVSGLMLESYFEPEILLDRGSGAF